MLTLDLAKSLKSALKREARLSGRTVEAIVADALTVFLERCESKRRLRTDRRVSLVERAKNTGKNDLANILDRALKRKPLKGDEL